MSEWEDIVFNWAFPISVESKERSAKKINFNFWRQENLKFPEKKLKWIFLLSFGQLRNFLVVINFHFEAPPDEVCQNNVLRTYRENGETIEADTARNYLINWIEKETSKASKQWGFRKLTTLAEEENRNRGSLHEFSTASNFLPNVQ